MGLALPVPRAAAYHAALMIGGFLGTVISLERAIALGTRWAFAVPACSGAGALLLLSGAHREGLLLLLLAALGLAAVSAALLRRQFQQHIVLLLVGGLAWAGHNALALAGEGANATAAWGFAFLVLTIAAERLEMTRLMKRRALAAPLFYASLVVLLAGAGASVAWPQAGGIAFGAGLVCTAAWLATFDLARRTVRAEGFARYAAVALLTGYAWLALGGVAWMLMVSVAPSWRDAALHAIGLGFVVSMILAHAPVVVPVVARVRMRYHPAFYAPLALLHVSLVWRLAFGPGAAAMRQSGGVLNALALAAFVGTLAYALSRKTTIAGPPAHADPEDTPLE